MHYLRRILCAVNTSRPGWNKRTGFFQGVSPGSFSTNSPVCAVVPAGLKWSDPTEAYTCFTGWFAMRNRESGATACGCN